MRDNTLRERRWSRVYIVIYINIILLYILVFQWQSEKIMYKNCKYIGSRHIYHWLGICFRYYAYTYATTCLHVHIISAMGRETRRARARNRSTTFYYLRIVIAQHSAPCFCREPKNTAQWASSSERGHGCTGSFVQLRHASCVDIIFLDVV